VSHSLGTESNKGVRGAQVWSDSLGDAGEGPSS
jgi:hypothetical protein